FVAALADDAGLNVVRALAWFGFGLGPAGSVQFFPDPFGQAFRQFLHVGFAIVAEDEPDTAIVVPAIEVLRLGKIGVAAKQNFTETAAQASRNGPLQCVGGAFVGRAITRAVDQPQDFVSVGQGDHQGMIAPGAIVSDVHAFFAVAGGFDQRAIDVENGLLKEGGGLLPPNADAYVIKDVLQQVDLVSVKTTAEIGGGRGIGNATG